MAANVLVDAGFLVALLVGRDANHNWAVTQSAHLPPPWRTCDAVLSETFHLLSGSGVSALVALLERKSVLPHFILRDELAEIVRLMRKYDNVPMSLADACLVRMTETLTDTILLTTDRDFRIYRRHSRKTIPAVMPH